MLEGSLRLRKCDAEELLGISVPAWTRIWPPMVSYTLATSHGWSRRNPARYGGTRITG